MTDLHLAVRSLRQRPGFSALVVFTLALGIGATTAVFGLVNQLLLRPLPGIEDPNGVAYLEFRKVDAPDETGSISALDFFDLRRETSATIESVGAFARISNLVRLAEGERPTKVQSNLIGGDYFGVLGVTALRGRLLTAEETTLEADPNVAVISEALWTHLLGRAEDVVGRTIDVDGRSVTIVGVTASGFMGAKRDSPTEMWVPLPARPGGIERLRSRESLTFGSSSGSIYIRPRKGVSFADAEAEVTRALHRLAEANEVSREVLANRTPKVYPSLTTEPYMREITSGVLRTMSTIAALVLLLACANVANLLLFRGLRRRGDIAVRRAMGASAARVARQELISTILLCALGTAVGLAVAWGIGFAFRGERVLFRSDEFQGMTLDLRLLLFAGAALVTTSLLAGVLPAALAGRVELTETLKETARGDSRRHALVRGALSTLQLALCVPLLVGSALLVRTVRNLNSVDLGMDPSKVAFLNMGDVGSKPMERQLQLIEAVRAIPGIDAVALDYPGPFWSTLGGDVRLPTQTVEEATDVTFNYATSGWFEILGMEPVAGRTFKSTDLDPGAPSTVILTAPLARKMFGRTNVLGERLITRPGSEETAEIIGVLGDIRMAGPGDPPAETIFLPYTKRILSEVNVMVRPEGGILTPEISKALVEAAATTFPELPRAADAAVLSSRIDRQLAEKVVLSRLLTLVSALALLLAAIGVYGVISFAVAARRRELGIRLALGSSLTRIGSLVMAQAAVILVIGLIAGVFGARALSTLLASRLYDVAPTDPRAYASGVIALTVAAILACVLPLRSALSVDPVVTLKND